MISLKAGLIIVGVLMLWGFGFYCGSLRGKSQVSQMQLNALTQLAKAYQTQRLEALDKQAQLEKENDELKDDQLKYPDLSVGVCRVERISLPTANGSGQIVSTTAGSLPARVIQPVDKEIGPELFSFADEADAIVAKCRSL